MKSFSGITGLYTDFYELTMTNGYFIKGRWDEPAVFDYFFRTNPFGSGFTVFAGIGDFADMVSDFRFSPEDTGYLRSLGLHDDFLDYLSRFEFRGSVFSAREGEVVFPQEPLVRIEGNLIEAQLLESMLLNVLNYQSLVATKAFRIRMAAGNRMVSEFGLRRAPGLGSMMASRASCIGGANATSNVMAALRYGIPPSGTIAHSWIKGYPSELEAFRDFAEIYGNSAILLVDTYDTLRKGIPNAIAIGKEMEQKGQKLKGIRLDSGDLAFLSKRARKMLDEAGLNYVMIVASNQLNEHRIRQLLDKENAPIDAFGVGTDLVSGRPDAALDGVYKLSVTGSSPRMKITENIEKSTLPGKKELFRFYDSRGSFCCDGILLDNEAIEDQQAICHLLQDDQILRVKGLQYEKLLSPVIVGGKKVIDDKKPAEIFHYLKERAEKLPAGVRDLDTPDNYPVGISEKLRALRTDIVHKTIKNE